MVDHVKYIIVEDGGTELPIMFNPILSHKQVAGGAKVVGAGEVGLYPTAERINVSCWGKSVTLGVESRGEDDAKLIDRTINDY